MRNHATAPLPPILWSLVPLTPLPEVVYLMPSEGWLFWDAAVIDQDKDAPHPPDDDWWSMELGETYGVHFDAAIDAAMAKEKP